MCSLLYFGFVKDIASLISSPFLVEAVHSILSLKRNIFQCIDFSDDMILFAWVHFLYDFFCKRARLSWMKALYLSSCPMIHRQRSLRLLQRLLNNPMAHRWMSDVMVTFQEGKHITLSKTWVCLLSEDAVWTSVHIASLYTCHEMRLMMLLQHGLFKPILVHRPTGLCQVCLKRIQEKSISRSLDHNIQHGFSENSVCAVCF